MVLDLGVLEFRVQGVGCGVQGFLTLVSKTRL